LEHIYEALEKLLLSQKVFENREKNEEKTGI
jgi:hypothetical protein